MKIAKDFKSFKKIKRKYYKRHTIKRVDHFNGKRFTSYWENDDWLGYVVKTYDEFKQRNISDDILWNIGPVAFSTCIRQIEELYNTTNTVTFKSKDGEYTGYFKGIIITNRDANYLLEDINTKENMLIPMFWIREEEK